MTIEEFVKTLQSRLPGLEVQARDLTGDGNHFEAIFIGDAFDGKNRIDRQRLILNSLSEEWKGSLHALTLKTYTRQEWENL